MLIPVSRRAFGLLVGPALLSLSSNPPSAPPVPSQDTISALQGGVGDLYSDKAANAVPKLLKVLDDPAFGPSTPDKLGRGSVYRLLGDASSVQGLHSDSYKFYTSAADSLTADSYSPLPDDVPAYNSELSLSLLGKSRAAYGYGVPPLPSKSDYALLAKDLEKGITLSCTNDYEVRTAGEGEGVLNGRTSGRGISKFLKRRLSLPLVALQDNLLLCGGAKNPFLLWELGRALRDSGSYPDAAKVFEMGRDAFKMQGDALRSYLCDADAVIAKMEAPGYTVPESAFKYELDGPRQYKSRQLSFLANLHSGSVSSALQAADFEPPKRTEDGTKRGWTLDDDFERLKGGRPEWEKTMTAGLKSKLNK